MRQTTQLWGSEDIARRWQALAERRRQHFAELHETGRWRKYYREFGFHRQMRETARMAEAWSKVIDAQEAAPARSDSAPRPVIGLRRF